MRYSTILKRDFDIIRPYVYCHFHIKLLVDATTNNSIKANENPIQIEAVYRFPLSSLKVSLTEI
jgi:hypothetical protein